MAEDLKKKQEEQLQEEQLDEVNGGIPQGLIQEGDAGVHLDPRMPV